MIDLTPAEKAEMLVNRAYLPAGIFPILEYNDNTAGWTELVTFDPKDGWDWDLSQQTTPGAAPKNYLLLRVIDKDGLEALLDQGEAISYNGRRYKFSRGTIPFGLPAIWKIRLDYAEDVTP